MSEHPEDGAGMDVAGWDAFEQAHPDTFSGMYRFWARRPLGAQTGFD